jgi:hypothetical protein
MARERANPLFADRDNEFAERAQVFASVIAADPQRYFLTEEDAGQISAAVEQFCAALRPCVSRASRTVHDTEAKRDARARAEAVLRPYANLIRVHPKIPTEAKLSVFIRERAARPQKSPPPETRPRLMLSTMNDPSPTGTGIHRFKFGYENEDWAVWAKRPPHAARLEVFVEFFPPNARIPTSPDDHAYLRAIYLGSFSRSPVKVKYPMPSMPMIAVYWARWVNNANEYGPMSHPLIAGLVAWHTALEALNSPTRYDVRQMDGRSSQTAAFLPRPERALTQLPAPEAMAQLPAPAGEAGRMLEERKVTVEAKREIRFDRREEAA